MAATELSFTDQARFGGSQAIYPTPFSAPERRPHVFTGLWPSPIPILNCWSVMLSSATGSHLAYTFASKIIVSCWGHLLVAPDPSVAKVSQFFARDEHKRERLVTLVQPRNKQTLNDLRLTVYEQRFGAISTFEQRTVPTDGCIITESPGEIRASGYMLAHGDRGLIDYQPPTSLIRLVGINMEVASRRVKLQTRDSKKKGAETKEYEIFDVQPRRPA